MKRIKWNFLSYETIKEDGELNRFIVPKDFAYSDEALAAAEVEAWNGEYEIYDDDQPDPATVPTQLDRIEAQMAYMAMMTGTLIEE